MEIQFYDVKRGRRSGARVGGAEDALRQDTKDGGTRTTYALRATYDGRQISRFCSKEDWEGLQVPEE